MRHTFICYLFLKRVTISLCAKIPQAEGVGGRLNSFWLFGVHLLVRGGQAFDSMIFTCRQKAPVPLSFFVRVTVPFEHRRPAPPWRQKEPPTLLGPGVYRSECLFGKQFYFVSIHAPTGGATISIEQIFQFTRLSARLPAYSANNLFVLRGIYFLGLRLVNIGQLKQNLFVLIHTPFGETLASDSRPPPPTADPCGPTDFSKTNHQLSGIYDGSRIKARKIKYNSLSSI